MYAPFPPGYDVNAKCDYQMGALGYTVDNCKELKHKVQDLIDCKAITFTPNGSNVKTNPMPTHADPSVNAVKESDSLKLVTVVEET